MRQEIMGFGMQWHQLDHMQTICTWLQTDNHTNTSMNMQIGCELFTVKQATRFFWRFIFFISVNLYTYGSAEILITKMQKNGKVASCPRTFRTSNYAVELTTKYKLYK